MKRRREKTSNREQRNNKTAKEHVKREMRYSIHAYKTNGEYLFISIFYEIQKRKEFVMDFSGCVDADLLNSLTVACIFIWKFHSH